MKKKTLSALLVLAMVLTLLPATALAAELEEPTSSSALTVLEEAEESADAALSTQSDLQDAINAAEGATTLTLEGTITGNISIPAGKDITLIGNGSTLEGSISIAQAAGEETHLTIQGLTMDGKGSASTAITSQDQNSADPLDLYLTLEGCSIKNYTNKGIYLTNCKELTVSGCSFNENATTEQTWYKGDYAFDINLCATTDAVISITNCTFGGESGGNAPIKVTQRGGAGQGTDDVNSDIKNPTSATIKSLTISGCDFTGVTGEPMADIILGSSPNGGTENPTSPRTYCGQFPVSVTANSSGAKVLLRYIGSGSGESYVDGLLCEIPAGQTYTKTAEGDFAQSFVAKIGDNTYATLESAVKAAAPEDEITLLSNVSVTDKIVIDKSLTINGANKVISGVSNDSSVYFEITGGTVDIKNVTVQNFGDAAPTNSGIAVFKVPSGSYGVSLNVESVTVKDFCRSAFDLRAGSFSISNSTIDCTNNVAGSSNSKLTKGVLAGLGTSAVTGSIENTSITNSNSNYADWSSSGVEVYQGATVTITGGSITNVANGVHVDNYYTGTVSGAEVTIGGTTVTASNAAARVYGTDSTNPGTGKITVAGGKLTGAIGYYGDQTGSTFVITGTGHFTSDPTAFLSEDSDLMVITGTESGYAYSVVEKEANAAEVSTAAPEVSVPSNLGEEDAAAATEVSDALKASADVVTGTGLMAAANTVANNNTLTDSDEVVTDALAEAGVSTVGETVTIVVQPYMDIDISAVSTTGDTKTMTLDIVPMYRTVATTADLSLDEDIVLSAEEGTVNGAAIGSDLPLTITEPVVIAIPLPTGFTAESEAYVTHTKTNSLHYVYTGTVSGNTLTFTNPNGFSTFSVSTANTAVAAIGDVGFLSLQEAVNAVQNGQTINVTGTGLSATVSRAVTFTVTGEAVTLRAGSGYSMTNESGTYTFTYVGGGSSGGGGGGGVSTYSVKVNDPDNGTVTSSHSTASKGTTVTLTVKANDGYVLKSLTVTDKDGDSVALSSSGSNRYTFSMPASAVTVQATFVKESSFTDVAVDSYCYDAVLWAVEEGITNGTTATTFSPNAACTRGQIVTFLWRAAGSPAPASAVNPFTDVEEGSYCYDAVLWAVESGITTGVTATTFAPNATCTRGQAMTFLWRQAGSPESSNSNIAFTDVAEDSFCYDAVLWAVKQGITNGTTATTFSPNDTCVRGQIVTFLWRYMAD